MMRELVRSAEETARRSGRDRPRFVGVSVLTSIDQELLNTELNIAGPLQAEVVRRGRLAAEAGLDGIVCSAAELSVIKPYLPRNFFYVTPGVRGHARDGDDHKRTASYREAIQAGADLLVVGRSILGTKDPRRELQELRSQIQPAGDEERLADDTRTLYEVLHGLFTEYAVLEVLSELKAQGTFHGSDAWEVEGRLALSAKRLQASLAGSGSKVESRMTALGRRLLQFFRERSTALAGEVVTQDYDLAGHGEDFDHRVFCARNGRAREDVL